MKITFRADASLQIGTGHVMRCLTLADALAARGADCQFICRAHEGNLIDFIRAKGYTTHPLSVGAAPPLSLTDPTHAPWLGATQTEDTEACAPILAAQHPDWLIVDHYALDARWERALAPYYRKLMAIDDLADRPHVCDLLLDQNYGRTAIDYARLVPAHCRMLVGSGHALLRPQFAAKHTASLARRAANDVKHFLIQMGGIDQHNYTGEALSVLQECELPTDTRITVVLSREAPAIDAVRRQVAAMKWPVAVMVGVENMAKLMEESDLAIGSGGGATYERIYMGLPSILRPTAANQIEPLRKMAGAGLIEFYQDAVDLAHRIERLLRNGAHTPSGVVGDGTAELADELLQTRATLRQPRALDVRRTFRWLQDDELRALFLMRQKPELESHFRYWRGLLQDPQQHVFSIYDGPVHVGNAGLKNLSMEKGEAEIWLYLGDSATRRKGIGQQALNELERIIRCNLGIPRAILHVSETNGAAISLYQRAGYVQVRADPQVLAAFERSDVIKMEKRL